MTVWGISAGPTTAYQGRDCRTCDHSGIRDDGSMICYAKRINCTERDKLPCSLWEVRP